ncbi:cupin domain-containing protein [Aeromicrobium sp. IC_218]|uniref:cupin domain-containing protein n=1 Tax=Aeromicrobium sp. IC_218 TaxID=2545468 RepID=UPI001F61AEE2|nr:cupin domain-containing protein [Aeromicrobium sp. IC_218]
MSDRSEPGTTKADERLLAADVQAHELLRDDAGGTLPTSSTVLGELGHTEVGLWEAGPGTDHDTEVDEVFVVLAGAATVTFDDGSSLALRPGVAVRLHAGDRTRWDVTERLRKLYLA